jgi:low affinity Fe/Cu permease
MSKAEQTTKPGDDVRRSRRFRRLFARGANATARGVGHPATFLAALMTVAGWAFLGPRLDFNETWQLWINTGTTILTFLMVILLQNSQNRQSDAVQLKLGELLRAVQGARVSLVDVEKLDDEEVARLGAAFERLGQWARRSNDGRVAVGRDGTEDS